jgi:hypothetical protein
VVLITGRSPAAGDALHEFALYLFNKLDGGEAWSEVEALNAMLQACLPPIPRVQYGMVTAYTAAVHHEQKIRLRAAASDKQDTSITGFFFIYFFTPPFPITLHYSYAGVHPPVCSFPHTHTQSVTPLLFFLELTSSFRSPILLLTRWIDAGFLCVAFSFSPLALDSLRLDYAVAWPLNLIINPRTLLLYNEIMVFLMQVLFFSFFFG